MPMTPSQIFSSFRGGPIKVARCPPSLFALALGPLVILVRESRCIEWLWVGPLEKKISLYADDTLLYLHDAASSLNATLEAFNEFGHFSGIRINWIKSVLFPIDVQARATATQTSLIWVEDLTYLGIRVTRNLQSFQRLNLQPVVTRVKNHFSRWADLPLNLQGRINILKIIYLPKFKFIFRDCPTWIPLSFKRLGQLHWCFFVAGISSSVSQIDSSAPSKLWWTCFT